jgi:hypothetical protein
MQSASSRFALCDIGARHTGEPVSNRSLLLPALGWRPLRSRLLLEAPQQNGILAGRRVHFAVRRSRAHDFIQTFDHAA